jgi:acetyl-CoA carboxylase carboxyl transferase subunit beta
LPEVPQDPLRFRDDKRYSDRLKEYRHKTSLPDALTAARGTLDGVPVVIAVQSFEFMGGSLGLATGAALVSAMRAAVTEHRPFILIVSSGGARMQEGILSLMQLPKTVCAVEDLHDAGGTLISVMAHPTTAGVLASFASLGDVIVAEPGALLSFTGPRVVQQTTREKLPEDFGLAESNYRHGHVDAIVPRPELRPTLGRLLRLFANGT